MSSMFKQASWKTKPLGDLCTVVAGGTPSRRELTYYGGEIPWVKISDMLNDPVVITEETITHEGLENSPAKLLPAGTLLISIFATIGRTAVLGTDAATNQAIVGVIPKKGVELNNGFLRRFLDHSVSSLVNQARGVAQSNVNGSILKGIEVPLPPLGKQEQIAHVLDKADAIRRKRRHVREDLAHLREACFLNHFGDPVHNTKGWSREPLGALVSPMRSITYGILKPGDNTPGGVPMLRIQDIDDGVLNTHNLHRVSEELSNQYRRTILDGTEIVISLVGSIGIVAIIPPALKGANVHRNLGVIVPGPRITRTYLYCLMRLPCFASLLRSSIKGGNQALLNLGALDVLEIPVPPLAIQKAFEEAVTRIADIEGKAAIAICEAESLFNSLVQRAFRGEL